MAQTQEALLKLTAELATALDAFRAETAHTDWQNHPRLLDAIHVKDQMVALAKGDYLTLWQLERAAHEETREKAAVAAKEARKNLVQLSRAYLKRIEMPAAALPQSCARCCLPPSCCSCHSRMALLRALLMHSPAVPSSPPLTSPPSEGEEDEMPPPPQPQPASHEGGDDDLYN